MKTNFIKLIAACCLLFVGFTTTAQQAKNVGDTHTYNGNPENTGNTFAWSITTTVTDGWEYAASTSASSQNIQVLWKKPGSYSITFTETEAHGGVSCSTTTSELIVTVSNTFDVSIADATTACATTSANSTVTFTLTKTNGGANWSFDYTTTGLTPAITGADISASGNTHILSLDIPNVSNGSDKTFSITISDVRDSYGNTDIASGNNVTGDVTVYGLPNTSAITY